MIADRTAQAHPDPQCSRFWLTAKGWRELGITLPEDIADDEVVIPGAAR